MRSPRVEVHQILQRIIASTHEAVEARRRRVPLTEVRRAAEEKRESGRDFAAALRRQGDLAIIAECKRASPSAGILRDPYDPAAIAREYQRLGAAAVSVLTEEGHFHGALEHLAAVRGAVALPVLRKDFVIDIYQVYETAAFGADAVLLISALLDDALLRDLYSAASAIGLGVLVETHTADDIDRALRLRPRVVGVNVRDLRDFSVEPSRAVQMRPLLPSDVVAVAESGVADPVGYAAVRAAGYDAVLIGTYFMRASSIEAAFSALTRRSSRTTRV